MRTKASAELYNDDQMRDRYLRVTYEHFNWSNFSFTEHISHKHHETIWLSLTWLIFFFTFTSIYELRNVRCYTSSTAHHTYTPPLLLAAVIAYVFAQSCRSLFPSCSLYLARYQYIIESSKYIQRSFLCFYFSLKRLLCLHISVM